MSDDKRYQLPWWLYGSKKFLPSDAHYWVQDAERKIQLLENYASHGDNEVLALHLDTFYWAGMDVRVLDLHGIFWKAPARQRTCELERLEILTTLLPWMRAEMAKWREENKL